MKTIVKQIIKHVVLPLIIGVLVYVFFRNNTIFSVDFFYIQSYSNLIKIIKNHLSDCLWAYSLTSCVLILTNIYGAFICIISVVFVLVMEVLSSKYFNQTFDWLDVIFMSFSCIIAIKLVKRNTFIFK